jgi:C4-dicarboxylate-specific signal transduction histidine kinase
MLATFAIQIGLIAAVQGGPANAPLIDLQFLLLTLAMTALVLGAVVTGRHAAEARLREQDRALARAMRSAVAGELATALTHELNQPITALVSYLRAAEILAAPVVQQDPRLQQTLAKAAGEAIRTADVLKRLRDFYRGGAAPPERVPVGRVVTATVQAFQPRIRQAGVVVQVRVDENLPDVVTDRIGIEMVLHNLIGNALDALDDVATGRRLEIGVRRDGDGIIIDVDDSGPGCSDEIRARLFEPFVTTKPDGMGLGLPISRSLLRSQGGDLWADRSALGGARFSLRVPDQPVPQTAV